MADALDALGDLNVNPYVLAQPNPPGLQILPPALSFDFANARGIDEWTFVIQGFVSLGSTDVGSQMILDQLLTPNGVKAALEADKTLGGLVADLRVTSSGDARVVEPPGGSPMLLVEWRVTMFVSGG